MPTLRKPLSPNLGQIAEAITYAVEVRDWFQEAPRIYINDESTSYQLMLHSAQGPNAGESDVIQARRILRVLLDAGLTATASSRKVEGNFLKPAPKP